MIRRRQFGGTKHREDGDSNVGDPDGDDYMAGVSTREAMVRSCT